MLEKVMPQLWKSYGKWSPNWSPNPEKCEETRGKQIDAKTDASAQICPEGRRLWRPPQSKIKSSLLVSFSSCLRLVCAKICTKILLWIWMSSPAFFLACRRFTCLLFYRVLFILQRFIRLSCHRFRKYHLNCQTRPKKRLNARSLKRPMLHTLPFDEVSSPDVNLHGSATPADPIKMQ